MTVTGAPHRHTPHVRQEYPNIRAGNWVVEYGGILITITREGNLPTPELTRTATQKAIAKHDNQTDAYLKSQIALKEAEQVAREAAKIAQEVVERASGAVDNYDEKPAPAPAPGKVPWWKREFRGRMR